MSNEEDMADELRPPLTEPDRTPSSLGSVLSLGSALAVTSILWSGTLRTDATPYGDGSRIMKWLAFVQGHRDTFELWNPFRNGGYPVFADPEQFWFLAPFVNTASVHANLQLNIALFVVLLLPAAAAWVVARRLGLNFLWAAVAAILIGFNEPLILLEQSARFAGFINLTSLLAVLAIVSRRRLDIFDYAMLAVCMGVAFAVAVQYAILQTMVIFSSFLFGFQANSPSRIGQAIGAMTRTAAVCLAGLALAAVVVFPLFGHLRDAHVPLEGIQYQPVLLHHPSQLLRFFLPFVPSAKPIFLSLLVVPACVVGVVFGAPDGLRHWLRSMTIPIAYVVVFSLMCLPFLGPWLAENYSRVPIISSVRQFGSAVMIFVVLSALATALAFQFYGERRMVAFGRGARIALGVYFALAAATCAIFGTPMRSQSVSVVAAIASALLLVVAIYFIVTVFDRWRVNPIENKKISTLALGLCVLSLFMLAPTAFVEHHLGLGRPIHISNDVELPRLYQTVISDHDGYYQFLKDMGGVWFLHSFNRGGAAFSLYFPKGQAHSFSLISSKYELSRQRPHWVRPLLPCKEFEVAALELLAVKYLFCRKSELNGFSPPGFEVAGSQDGIVLFRRTAKSDSLLHVFCRSRQSPPSELRESRENVLDAFSHREVLLDSNSLETRSDPGCPDDAFADANVRFEKNTPNEMLLTVESRHAGMLVIPDNFARGWSATVNGQQVPISRAFYAYRAVPVMRGQNRIRLVYTDPYVTAGLFVSTAAFALVSVTAWVGLRARRRMSFVSA